MFRDAFNSLFREPSTELYPAEHRQTPERFRGKLFWSSEAGCTGCALCVKDCPANALELIVIDKAAKKFAMRYHVDRCAYCGQCVQSCRFDCLKLSNTEWELASDDRETFVVEFKP